MKDNPKMLWIARDFEDECTWVYSTNPSIDINGYWNVDNDEDASMLHDNDAVSLQPGECKVFIEFAPRVATDEDRHPDAPARLWWAKDGWSYSAPTVLSAGEDIILPMPPDPTPYLAPLPGPKDLRIAEIDAQIAELYAERAELEDR